MKTFLDIICEIILYIWQLPQNIIGFILRSFFPKATITEIEGVNFFYYEFFPGGISLGNTILLNTLNKSAVLHEHGHQIQSLYLGPLYLIVIGIPSIIWAGIYGTKICPRTHNGYYKFYTEKSADKLGGVIRD